MTFTVHLPDLVERWADEDAAADVGDPDLAAAPAAVKFVALPQAWL